MKWSFLALAIAALMYSNCESYFPGFEATNSSFSNQCQQNAGEQPQSPKSIDQVVDLINSLPKPLTIPCLIESLEKPLKVFAVNNSASAQPSAGSESPRIFILINNLSLSVVPAGEGKDFVELGQFVNPTSSIKAEIEFPITANLTKDVPYSSISNGTGGTKCVICHQNESQSTGTASNLAFQSDVLPPNPFLRVSQKKLKSFALNCNDILTPERCQMLRAIFLSGNAYDVEWPQ